MLTFLRRRPKFSKISEKKKKKHFFGKNRHVVFRVVWYDHVQFRVMC